MVINPDKEYIELLNASVAREIGVTVQYMLQHTKMEKIKRKVIPENMFGDTTVYDKIGEVLKGLAIEEMKHIAAIAERMFVLGIENVTTKPTPIKIGDTPAEFCKIDLKAEEEALELYRKVIKAARERGDEVTKRLFQKIYEEEENHRLALRDFTSVVSDPEPKTEDAEWLSIFDDNYVALLNKALASEISAIVQYTIQHEKASMEKYSSKSTPLEVVNDTNKAQVISGILKPIFMQEMEHFEAIAERLFTVGKEALADADPIPNIGGGPDDWIINDRKAENDAIMLYRKIIKEASDRGDITTKVLFEKIIQEEEEHYWTFDDYVS